MLKNWILFAVVGAVLCGMAGFFYLRFFPSPEGWGINGRISLLSEVELDKRLALLQRSGVSWLREDFQWKEAPRAQQSKNLAIARQRGFQILALIPYGTGQKPRQPEDQLPEDLLQVFQAAENWSRDSGAEVDAWELYNEADVGFCRDLPDRSTAYIKAVYLGLKSGARKKPVPVIMGALALPPGPWLERSLQNGLLDYADAYNIHYYGLPGDLEGVLLENHKILQQAKKTDLPLWITECGYAAGNDPADHLRQAEYFQQLLPEMGSGKVAVFLPYALQDKKGFELLDPDGEPFPAWDIFSDWSKKHRGQVEPIFLEQKQAPALVLQWLPQGGSCIPHKVSGCYRFRPPVTAGTVPPISGEIRIYNFGDQPVTGSFKLEGLHSVLTQANFLERIVIPPHGMKSIPTVFALSAPGYFREWCTVHFQGDEKAQKTALTFGLESSPRKEDFLSSPLPLAPWPQSATGNPVFQYIDDRAPYAVTAQSGFWIGLNGLRLASTQDGLRITFPEKAGAEGPPMAIAPLKGLPEAGFLRFKSDLLFDRNFNLRVDLVDDLGQRFTIFENGGMNYFVKENELWLNLADFHLYFWGRSLNAKFAPSRVREIQFKPYSAQGGKEVNLEVSLMIPQKPPF